MADANGPDIEVRDSQVVAYFPASIQAAYLSPGEARRWASALIVAADAAERLTEYPNREP